MLIDQSEIFCFNHLSITIPRSNLGPNRVSPCVYKPIRTERLAHRILYPEKPIDIIKLYTLKYKVFGVRTLNKTLSKINITYRFSKMYGACSHAYLDDSWHLPLCYVAYHNAMYNDGQFNLTKNKVIKNVYFSIHPLISVFDFFLK